jgi:phosphinothricin acetyltransferase
VKNAKIRLASAGDSEAILEIYSPYIINTSVTFEIEVPPLAEFRERIRNISEVYPWIICEIDGGIAGYAYAAGHHERAAYQWAVNLSVYIGEDYKRKGLGSVLYATLFDILEHLGYFTGLACVTRPNPQSEKFHESFGFRTVGIYHHVGFKLGRWHDVVWYEAPIKEPVPEPLQPLAIKNAPAGAINAILLRKAGLLTI